MTFNFASGPFGLILGQWHLTPITHYTNYTYYYNWKCYYYWIFPAEVQQIIIFDKGFFAKNMFEKRYLELLLYKFVIQYISTNSCYLVRLIIRFCYPQFRKFIFQHFSIFSAFTTVNNLKRIQARTKLPLFKQLQQRYSSNTIEENELYLL